MDRGTLVELFRALAEEGVAYVLVGGVAVNRHGIVRATEDVDLIVRADTHNVGRLRSALRRVFDDPDIDQITAPDLAGPYPVVRYVPPGGVVVDLLARLGERIGFEDLEVETRMLDGVPLRLATPATLHRMKRDTASDRSSGRRAPGGRLRPRGACLMPIERYRDIGELAPPPPADPTAPGFLERVFGLWAVATDGGGARSHRASTATRRSRRPAARVTRPSRNACDRAEGIGPIGSPGAQARPGPCAAQRGSNASITNAASSRTVARSNAKRAPATW